MTYLFRLSVMTEQGNTIAAEGKIRVPDAMTAVDLYDAVVEEVVKMKLPVQRVIKYSVTKVKPKSAQNNG